MEIESKISAMDSKQYYNLGMGKSKLADEDSISENGSEDIDTVIHRYDPPKNCFENKNVKSIAEEMKEDSPPRAEPPPDILVSSNCRRKIWPKVDLEFEEDYWDMEPIEAPLEENIEVVEAVDIVVRNQPSSSSSSNFYRNSRRMIVHQVQGVEVRPNCGSCCTLQ